MNAAATSTGEPLVVLDKVDKWFGDLHVLQDINLSVTRGEVVVLLAQQPDDLAADRAAAEQR